MSEWQNGKMAKWQYLFIIEENVKISEWQNGRMAEWQNLFIIEEMSNVRMVKNVHKENRNTNREK